MLKFILKRFFLETIPSLLVIATITFFLIRLAPGGPFSGEKSIDPQVLAQLNGHYGLDKPLLVQYVNYLANVSHGDFGPSFKYPNRSVTELIGQSFAAPIRMRRHGVPEPVQIRLGHPPALTDKIRFDPLGITGRGEIVPEKMKIF